jgi:prophage DNA circulation protein
MSGGRRLAVHQYPGRDTAWAEDMGRSARRFRLRGFILDGDIVISGDTIDLQRSNLVAAIEKAGIGTLIHPTLGSLNVVLDRGAIGEGLGANSYSEIELEFVESGEQTYPSANASTSSDAVTAAEDLDDVSADAANQAFSDGFDLGGTVEQALAAASSWTAVIESAVTDATAMYRLAARLVGSFGRYSAGANSGVSGINNSPYAFGTTVAEIVPTASINRQDAIEAAHNFVTVVAVMSPTRTVDVAAAARAMIAALVAACADPADAIRLLLSLLQHEVAGLASDMATAINRLVLRIAAAALTQVVTQYQPQSADDAALRISEIGSALYDLMTTAADAGEDDCFTTLRQCRGAIVTDLRTRGVTLARLRTFTFAAPLPSLVLAQSIYAASTRADELVTQTNPVHPLFMPTAFQALAA